MDIVLQTSNLSKNYSGIRALNNLNIALPSGKIIGLLGPNGSGKTTLIKLIAGLLTPTEGSIEVCGVPVGPETKSMISYLPDRVYFNQSQTVEQLLNYFQDFYADFDRQRAVSMLSMLRIPMNVKFKTLSKGAREKVQLALVMSRRAKLYLLDEPIAGVDPAARDFILHTIVTNYDPTATVLISTHLIADVEPVLDEFLFINMGQIICLGSVDDMRDKTGKTLDELFREVFKCLPSL
ncbi:MAG: ABC transporter ATP-binding protein [Oscillospiraceae bacterium]|nr:ABC transporter ATP-binding protein [Oscillospiraceae bacterium]